MREDDSPNETWQDPIVAEVRRAREALFAESGYDLHKFFQGIIARQATSGHPFVKRGEIPVETVVETLRDNR